MARLVRWLWVGVGLVWATQTLACAICAPSAQESTLVQRLFAADGVLLARPSGDGFSPVAVLKGALPEGIIRLQEPAVGSQTSPTQLLLYSAGSQSWRTAGALDASRGDWVQRLMRLEPVSTLSPDNSNAAWSQRLAFFASDLENAEPLLAQTAYEEIAQAPYAAMRTLRPVLDAQKLWQWLNTPSLAARRPLYALLWGMAASEDMAGTWEQALASEPQPPSVAELSALLAAYVELRGPQGLEWIERHYLADAKRTDGELQAAVLALGIHGHDGVRVSQGRVVQAYAALIRSNRARAGFVASDLANWGHWEFFTDFAALLKSGEPQTFASRYAMVLYLMRNPRPEARAAWESLRASGFL